MDKKEIYLILFLFTGPVSTILAQNPDAHKQIEALIESAVENLDTDADGVLILEDLEDLTMNKLNFNTASGDQLSKLHLLDAIQIEKLLLFREKYGPVLTLYELNAVDGLNPEILMKIEPFIWFGPVNEAHRSLPDVLKYRQHELLLRSQETLQKAVGYRKKEDGTIPFEGNRLRHYARYRFQAGNDVSAGITADKDPGEAFFSGSNPHGFDFYSAYLSLQINPVIRNITVGDFVVRNGQGLVLWQGFSMGKSMNALNLAKTGQGIRPNTSADENNFFRGAATSLEFGKTKFSLFISRKALDGNLEGSDSTGRFFTSLQTTGYHRTLNEIADKKSVNDFNTGILASWQARNLKLGAVISYRKFELPFIPAEQLYNTFYFRGRENMNAGVDYLFSKGRYQLFGEMAVSRSGGKAAVQGATLYLHDRIQLSTLFRHYEKNYHALWASPFSEGTMASNETGMYMGTRILPLRFVTFSAYSDYYHSSWVKYTTAGPSQGWDVFAQFDFKPSSRFSMYVRYKNEEKDRKFRFGEKYQNICEHYRKSRLHTEYNFIEWIVFKTRVEHVFYKSLDAENGIMVYQEVQLVPAKLPLNLTMRFAWFDTKSYNTRIYAYENDLLYAYSIPAYYGNGFRTYLNLKYKLNRTTEIWFKLANFLQNNVESIGSGYNQIQGNQKTELKFQLRVKL